MKGGVVKVRVWDNSTVWPFVLYDGRRVEMWTRGHQGVIWNWTAGLLSLVRDVAEMGGRGGRALEALARC